MTYTDNHQYDKLEFREQNWHQVINSNLDQLDTDVILKDTAANRPASPATGTWFLATDTLEISYYDGSWNDVATGGGATQLSGLNNVTVDTLANKPASGSAGDWYFTSDQNGIYHDPDGAGYDLIAEHPSNIGAGDLAFDPATQAELDSHAGNASAHHAKYTDAEAQTAINNDADHGSTASHNYFDANPSSLNQEGATTGQVIEWSGSQWAPASVSGGSGLDVENTDGVTLVSGASPMQAGTDLTFADDGDGSVTLNFTGSASTSNLDAPYYLCYEDAGTYYVKRTEDNTVVSSGTSGATQLQYALNNLPAISAEPVVAVRDDWTISSNVTTGQADCVIDLRGAYLSAGGSNTILTVNNNNVTVIGGTLDGAAQTDGTGSVRVLNVSGADECVFKDVTMINGGYYGLNIYECNKCRFINCEASNNFDDGIHPGSDTSGKNVDNIFIGCVANNNGEWGFNDRMGGVVRCANMYIGCYAEGNSKNGIGVWDSVGSTDLQATFHGCVAVNNDKNFKIEGGNHKLYGCISDGATTSGYEFDDRGNPSSAVVTIQLYGCQALDTATGLGWLDVNVLAVGGSYSSTFQGSTVGIAKFRDVGGVDGSDASDTIWVDDYATSSGAPTASNYETGMTVEDTGTGSLYYIHNGSSSQIA